MNQEKTVENWIDEEDLASRATLKPIHRFDGLYPEDAEESEAYWDFISWYLSRDFVELLRIPKAVTEDDFWTLEDDNSISFPYSSVDYQRLHPFDSYAYRLKKIYGRARDLAILHSAISQEAGRENIQKRFAGLVDEEFRSKVMTLLENYRKHPHLVDKAKLRRRAAELNGEIQRCKEIWKRYAYWE